MSQDGDGGAQRLWPRRVFALQQNLGPWREIAKSRGIRAFSRLRVDFGKSLRQYAKKFQTVCIYVTVELELRYA
jgi:hypothetical protein